MLTSDVRYQLHLLLYRRVQTIWMLLSTVLCILATIVFTNLESLLIAGAAGLWLGLQLLGVTVSLLLRRKVSRQTDRFSLLETTADNN